jgi:hypothetical protein
MLGHAHDLVDLDIELLVRLVRMRSDRAEYVVVSLRDGDEITVTLDPGRDGDDTPYPGRAGAANDGVELAAEVGEIEMAVTVDQHDQACVVPALST